MNSIVNYKRVFWGLYEGPLEMTRSYPRGLGAKSINFYLFSENSEVYLPKIVFNKPKKANSENPSIVPLKV